MSSTSTLTNCRFVAERCRTCAPHESCAFYGIPDMDRVARRRFYGRDFTIVRQGDEADYVYVICSGWIQVTHVTCAGRAVVDLFGPGTVFGLAGAVNGGVYLASARTLEECEMERIERSDFLRFVKDHPEVSFDLLKSLGHQLQLSMLHLYDLSSKVPSDKRLIRTLNRIAEQCGTETEAGRRIRFPLPVQMLADTVGCSRQWVSKILGTLVEQGLIRYKSGWITITQEGMKEGPNTLRQVGPPVRRGQKSSVGKD